MEWVFVLLGFITLITAISGFLWVFAKIIGWFFDSKRSQYYGMSRTEFEKKFRKTYLQAKTLDVVEVPQGTFDWVFNGIIGTGHIHQCTVLAGFNKSISAAFICHVDTSYAACGIEEFVKSFTKAVQNNTPKGEQITFDCMLMGSRPFWIYPYFVRKRILKELRKNEDTDAVKFEIIECPMAHFDYSISINTESCNYDTYLKNTSRKRLIQELAKNVYRSSSLSESEYNKRLLVSRLIIASLSIGILLIIYILAV